MFSSIAYNNLFRLPQQGPKTLKKAVFELQGQLACTWLDACYKAREMWGEYPQLNFFIARALHERNLKAKARAMRKIAHEERQAAWFAGGREAHYIAKRGPFGTIERGWFSRAMRKATGCWAAEPIEDDWCESAEEAHVWAELEALEAKAVEREQEWRRRFCKVCSTLDCADPWCGIPAWCAPLPEVVRECAQRDPALVARLRELIEELKSRRGAQSAYSFVRIRVKAQPSASPASIVNSVVKDMELASYAEECYPYNDIFKSIARFKTNFNLSRLVDDYNVPVFANHQNDTNPTEHGEGTVTIEKKSNVILTEQHATNVSGEVPCASIVPLVSSDNINTYQKELDRPFLIQNVTWKTGVEHPFNTRIAALDLPLDFVHITENSVNAIPFRAHRYFRGDMEISFMINANKFMCGQLVACWFYQPSSDISFKYRESSYSAVQTIHTLINAGTSNRGKLVVPYRYIKPMLEIGARDDKERALCLGVLSLFVLSPLQCISTTNNHVNVAISVSFANTEFTGNIDKSLNIIPPREVGIERPLADMVINHQMMESVIELGVAAALTYFKDKNRDQPTKNINPDFISFQPTGSWCIGTKEGESSNSLRLTHAQVPHPAHYVDDNFTISDIVCRYGIFNIISWKNSHTTGHTLLTIPAVPMFDAHVYKDIWWQKDDLTLYYLPPVAYMTNLFQFWRGHLKLRFDFVATSMHTGRLIIAYVPGPRVENITAEQMYASPYVIYDLKESQQLEFVVPYVCDKLFYPRNLDLLTNQSNQPAPGFVYVKILSPLCGMDQISDNIQIVCYIAGGSDFELAVPIQPTIGLPFVPTFKASTLSYALFTPGSYPYYCGTFTDFDLNNKEDWGSKDALIGILRYNTWYNSVANISIGQQQLDYTNKEKIFYVKPPAGFKIRQTYGTDTYTALTAAVLWPFNNDLYVIPCKSENMAKDWCQKMYTHKGKYTEFLTKTGDTTVLSYFFQYKNDDKDGYFGEENPRWTIVKATVNCEEDDSFEIVHQNDNRFETDSAPLDVGTGSFPSVSTFHFGEDFNDLKNLTRRYQPYSIVVVKGSVIKNSMKSQRTICSVPVFPQGLNLNTDITFSNLNRDGHIPLLLAGYRYFRGSVRFRILCSQPDIIYAIQHHPYLYQDSQSSQLTSLSTNIRSRFTQTNSFVIQSTTHNPVVNFEIPYYVPYDCILLQHPVVTPVEKTGFTDIYYATSLGSFTITVISVDKPISDSSTLAFEIYYSLGDDARPSVFQGFPPVIFTQDAPYIPPTELNHQMGLFDSLYTASSQLETLASLDLNRTNEHVVDTLEQLNSASSSLTDTLNTVRQAATITSDTFSSFLSQCSTNGFPPLLISALSQSAHVINNPEPKTMAIAIISFITSLGLFAIEMFSPIYDCLVRIFSRLQPQRLPGGELTASHQNEFSEDDVCAVGSMLFAGISSALNIHQKSSSKFSKGLGVDLMDGIVEGTRGSNLFFTFLRNVIKTIVKIFKYISRKFFPSVFQLESCTEDAQLIEKWANEALYLTDVQLEPLFDVTPSLAERVESCYTLGALIMSKLTIVHREINITILKDLYNKICTLRTELADKGICSALRREPFIICLTGAPGVGKSTMSHETIIKLLTTAGIPITTNPIYTHSPGAKYWENVNQEPCMFMDDVFVLKDGETADTEIATIMGLKSCALFTPPIANCDRKKKRYAPELVYMHSNNIFPSFNNMYAAEALYRRRDELWEVALVDNSRPISSYSQSELDSKVHLQFRRHANPAKKDMATPWSGWVSYNAFFNTISDKFIAFRNKQISIHEKKITMMQAAVQEITNYSDLSQQPLREIVARYARLGLISGLKFLPSTEFNSSVTAEHQCDRDILTGKQCTHDVTSALLHFLKHTKTQFSAKERSWILKAAMGDERILLRNLFLTRLTYNIKTYEDFVLCEIMLFLLDNNELFEICDCIFDWKNDRKETRDLIAGKIREVEVHRSYILPSTSTADSSITDNVNINEEENSESASCSISTIQTAYTPPSDEDFDAIFPIAPRIEDLYFKRQNLEEFVRTRARVAPYICAEHYKRFINDIYLVDVITASKLLGVKEYTTLSALSPETHKSIKTVISTRLCKHFFLYMRHQNCINCKCFNIPEGKKFATHVQPNYEKVPLNCKSDCICYQPVPIMNDYSDCDSKCICKRPSLVKLARRLYIYNHPGTIDALLETPELCPSLVYSSNYREKLVDLAAGIKQFFVDCKNYLSAQLSKIWGKLLPIRNFLSNHYIAILSTLSVLCVATVGCMRYIAPRYNSENYNSENLYTGPTLRSDFVEKPAEAFSFTSAAATDGFNKLLSCLSSKTSVTTQDVTESFPLPSLDSITHQITSSGDPRDANRSARSIFKAKTIAQVSRISPIAASHQTNHSEVVFNRIYTNTLMLIATESDHIGEFKKASRALCLGDRFVLTVRHFWEAVQSFNYQYISTFIKDRPIKIKVSDITFAPLEDSSLIVLRFPRQFPQFCKITSFFASEADHAYRIPDTGTLVEINPTATKLIQCTLRVMSDTVNISNCPGAQNVKIANLYHYRAQKPGMCGSLLLAENLNSPIIGMHIAGTDAGNFGFAEPLFRETFAFLFSERITNIVEPDLFPEEDSHIDLATTIFPLGSVGRKMAHHSPSNTAIHQSIIHGFVPPTTEPAPLSESDPRLPPNCSPLIKGCEKHGILTDNFPLDVLKRTKDRLKTHLFAKCKPIRQAPLHLTDSQAVVGDPQLPFCDALRWNSSEGYPFNKLRPKNASDKKWLFKLKDESGKLSLQGYHPTLRKFLKFKRSQRAEGIPQCTIFTDCLKDARIAKEKCSKPGKTRIFSMSPVDYTIDFRIYFYDFIASYQTNRLDNFNAIGINKFSEEWDSLARLLLEHKNICTGDYSNFGPGLNEEVAALCMEIILEWYDEFDTTQTLEIQRTRACLAYELIGAYHLANDLVYKVGAGIPSGSPITVVLNSLVNTFYLFAIWDMLSTSWPAELQNFNNFYSNISLFTYGDDFIMSVSDKYINYFNTQTIATKLLEFNIIMTDAFKGETITPYATLQESTFLKGSFNFFNNRWWYGLDKNQIYDMCNYVTTKTSILDATLQNAELALIEAHGWGHDFFQKFNSKLVKAFSKVNHSFSSRTFKEITNLKTTFADDPLMHEAAKQFLPVF